MFGEKIFNFSEFLENISAQYLLVFLPIRVHDYCGNRDLFHHYYFSSINSFEVVNCYLIFRSENKNGQDFTYLSWPLLVFEIIHVIYFMY